MMLGQITYTINSMLSVPITEDLLKNHSWLFQLKAAIFRTQQWRLFNMLPDSLRQGPDYNKFVRLAKKLMFSEGESVRLSFMIVIIFNHAVF